MNAPRVVMCHRTVTGNGQPWQWMSGPPSLGALQNLEVHPEWRIEYAYADQPAIDWQPIATAPLDGRDLLCCIAGLPPVIAHWNGKRWSKYRRADFEFGEAFDSDEIWLWITYRTGYRPTHWCELPGGA